MGKTERFKKTGISKVLLQTFKSFATFFFHYHLHLYLVPYASYLSTFTFSRIMIIQKSIHLHHKIILLWLWLRYFVVAGPLV